jgi:hypothetical protein
MMKRILNLISRNKRKIVFFFALFVIGQLFLASYADAQIWLPGQPLVPCGGPGQGPCDKCQLLHLAKNIIDFIMVAAAPFLAVVFFIVAGVYLMLGGTNPGMLASGKRMFKDTFIGILIVMLAWLITNTLIRTIADPAWVGQGGNWFTFSCSQIPLLR